MSFVRAPGAERRFTCTMCGKVYLETWTGRGVADYRVQGPDGDGVMSYCNGAQRIPHKLTVEVLSRGAA